jgi:hypothetical protein
VEAYNHYISVEASEYRKKMRAWRIHCRNWEAGVLRDEWDRGNTIIFAPDTMTEMIQEAIKV